MIGIYKITNKINGKCYIGQSVNITHRWAQHRDNSSKRKEALYLAMQKYGLDNFTFEVIEECSYEELDEKECYYIDYYNSYKNGYNMTLGGQHNKKYYIDEVRSLWDKGLSIKQIGEKLDIGRGTINNCLVDYENYSIEESNYRGGKDSYQTMIKNDTVPEHMKPKNIYQYDIWGNEIDVWPSAVEIEKQLGIDRGMVTKVMKKVYLQAGGYQWFLNKPEKVEDISSKIRLKFGVIQKDLDNNILNKFSSINDAALFLGKEHKKVTSISKCCSNKQETGYGFKWEYDYSVWDNKPYPRRRNKNE